jgi:integrase
MPNPTPRPKWSGPGKPPKGWWNESRRPHGEHLSRAQVDALIETARHTGRKGDRDALIIRTSFVHGLRVTEAANLLIEQFDFHNETVRMHRVKRGKNAMIHHLEPKDLKLIRAYIGDRRNGPMFLTERLTAFDESSLHKIIARAGKNATITVVDRETGEKREEPYFNFPVHFHMLRHACGYWLNDQGTPIRVIQDWLGHRNIRHTEAYTANSPEATRRVKFD